MSGSQHHHHHHHHVDAKTIGKELATVSTAITFLTEADSFIRLNDIAAVRGLPTPFLIAAANQLIAQADGTVSSLPNGSALAGALNTALIEDFTPFGVTQSTAAALVNALNNVLKLPPGAIFNAPNSATIFNADATRAAKHHDNQINQQLATGWNGPWNVAAVETQGVLPDFLHYRAAGFSPTAAVGATINDIQVMHTA
ncbi:MAG: hypothetical protein JO047_05400 [Alphaproteobacteria bacterium]|nr:hypothetical protein [Alphaproteobacteria bacterium]